MKNLSNELITEAYKKSCRLKLDGDFRAMLKGEINRRGIELNRNSHELVAIEANLKE